MGKCDKPKQNMSSCGVVKLHNLEMLAWQVTALVEKCKFITGTVLVFSNQSIIWSRMMSLKRWISQNADRKPLKLGSDK